MTSLLSDGHRTTKLKKPTAQASSMPRKPTKTSPKPAAFCKVLGDYHFSKRLSVPDDYIKNLNRLSSQMSLRRPSGRQWTVGLKVRNEGLFFCGGGWQQFVRDNFLELGNILVFGYDGDSTFEVKIFGRDGGCEKEDGVFGPVVGYSSGKHSEGYELQSLDDKHCEEAQISNERARKRLRCNEKLRCTTNKLKKNGVDASELMQGAYRTCVHCGTTKTPYWRRGPEGRNTLCNACGIRLSRHGSADPCVAYGIHIDRYNKKKSEEKHKLLRDERSEKNQIKEEMTELESHEVGNRVVFGRKLDAEAFRFYFENLWKSFSEDKRTSFTCLDCLWFSLYLNPNFKAKVLDWIKKQRIFSKKYVIVPIFSWSHWNLLIFCHFGESLQSENRKPCMLLLDSLKSADPMRFEPDIRKFVLEIFMEEGRPEPKDVIYQIPLLVPKVPQQRNDEEGGNFVLYFMKLFLEGASENFRIGDFPYFMNENWFAPEALDSFCEKLFSSAR